MRHQQTPTTNQFYFKKYQQSFCALFYPHHHKTPYTPNLGTMNAHQMSHISQFDLYCPICLSIYDTFYLPFSSFRNLLLTPACSCHLCKKVMSASNCTKMQTTSLHHVHIISSTTMMFVGEKESNTYFLRHISIYILCHIIICLSM